MVEGVEDIRKEEGYKDPSAKEKDKLEYLEAINNETVRVLEKDGEKAGFLYYRENFKVMYIDEEFLWVQLVYIKKRQSSLV